jgi:hypothetical protein
VPVQQRHCSNDEAKLRALITEFRTHEQLLFVVDQPATIGALSVAVARDESVRAAYLPGLAMRRIADLQVGDANTDTRDAAIIAEAPRSIPHTLHSFDWLTSRSNSPCYAASTTIWRHRSRRPANRIRGLLT